VPFATLSSGGSRAGRTHVQGLRQETEGVRELVGTSSFVDVKSGAAVAVRVMDKEENTTRSELKVA